MFRYVLLVLLVIPAWIAVELDAPKWVVMVAIVPFFLHAMRLSNPEDDLLGEFSGRFRSGALIVMGAGGLVLCAVILILWSVLFPAV